MGKIIAKSNDVSVYVSDAGYTTFTSPKHNYMNSEDYTLRQLRKAEKQYVKLVEILDKTFPGLFTPVSPGSYSLDKPSRNIDFNICNVFTRYSSAVGSLFSMQVQTGMVHNFPTSKFASTFHIPLVERKRNNINNGNKGMDVKTVKHLMSFMYSTVENIFTSKGLDFSQQKFNAILCLFKLHTAEIISGNVDGWVEYINAGITDIDIYLYGFNPKMFNSASNYIPVDKVKDYQGLPFEWVEQIFY